MRVSKLKNSVRLSKDILPKRYKLLINPDLESFTFAGAETIEIELKKSTKTLVLHSVDIEVMNCFWEINKNQLTEAKITYQKNAETVTFSFVKPLKAGKGKLHLEFRGIISDKLRGFYRSQYIQKGQTKHLATTQFESTDARRAFPCFDEPAHKAVFELSLIVPKHLTAISNTIEKITTQSKPSGISHDPNLKVIHFEPTPKMSTYLVAYIIGEFESIQTKTKDGVIIRVFTTPGKKKHAKFALECAKKTLEFLNSYFDIAYPLPVLDMIAIPDFSSAAMENWGAVTYREAAILIDEEHSAFANKQHVAEVVAHELVHQWFGNLVTMEWWTHLWLNESFASFMSYVVLENTFPEWKIWTRFVMHDHANALELDSLQNTHPIEIEVHHPDQISEIFDAISYDKGASVLRMLYDYIGPENFRDGLRYYLKKHSYKNTETIHLWAAFEKVSHKPIAKFMSKWVKSSGYPLLSVAESKPNKLILIQSKFDLNPNKKKDAEIVWSIPVKLPKLEVLNKKIALTEYNKSYVKLNLGETGFYRTLYSPDLLAKLYIPIQTKELETADRFGIIRDLFAIVKSGQLPTSTYLEFLTAYKDEDSYIIWAEILSGMKQIYNLYSSESKIQRQLANYFLQIIGPVGKKLGWNPKPKESPFTALLRSIILSDIGFYGDSRTLLQAKKIYNQKHLNPDIRSTIYFLTALDGDKKIQKSLQTKYVEHHLQEEQRRIARGLMSFNNPKILLDNLQFVLSNKVRSQDAPLFIAQALIHNPNRKDVWRWVQKNWTTFEKRYKGDHLLVWIIKGLEGFSTKAEALDIQQFFKKHSVPSASRALKQSIEQIMHKAQWLKKDKADCIKFLSQL